MAKSREPDLRSPLLGDLMNQLQDLDATITRCQAQRTLLLEKITAETDRLREEDDRALAGLEASVIARWDLGMTAPDIASVLHRPVELIERVLGAYRERNGVTIRRGRTVPERRKVR